MSGGEGSTEVAAAAAPPPSPAARKFLRASQTVSLVAVSGAVSGALGGAAVATVKGLDVGFYAVRVGANAGLLACCVGGINEALAALRGGERDAINPRQQPWWRSTARS